MLEDHVARLGAEMLLITWNHARLSGRLEWSHRDPFGRVLAAQAIRESLILVTVDRVFSGLPGLQVLW